MILFMLILLVTLSKKAIKTGYSQDLTWWGAEFSLENVDVWGWGKRNDHKHMVTEQFIKGSFQNEQSLMISSFKLF